MDIEDGTDLVDRAIRAVKAFQAGEGTRTFTLDCLKAVPASDLKMVAIGTRLPIKTLIELVA